MLEFAGAVEIISPVSVMFGFDRALEVLALLLSSWSSFPLPPCEPSLTKIVRNSSIFTMPKYPCFKFVNGSNVKRKIPFHRITLTLGETFEMGKRKIE